MGCVMGFGFRVSLLSTAGEGFGRDETQAHRGQAQVDVVIGNTVDGSEILHQLIWSISQYLQGFIYATWCRISSINSI